MSIEGNQIMSFGDFRRNIIGDINAVREGSLEVSRATAMVGLYKEVNSNIQAEINAAKMSLLTEEKAHQFGKVVSMGRRLIGNDPNQEAS
jgi:hypothetical protein